MKSKENIKYILLILCVLVLFVIPWAFVFGVKNEALKEEISVFQRSAVFIILTPIIVAIIYKVFKLKTVKQEIKEREAKKTDNDSEEKQFKPPLTIIVVILSMLFTGVSSLFLPEHPGDDKGAKFFISGFPIAFSLWWWYTSLVFTFTDDYLQIESALFHFFHIDRKKIFKYEDITRAKIERIPRAPYEMYALFISTNNEKKKRYPLFLNDDAVAKIYLHFKEKIGDRVKSL